MLHKNILDEFKKRFPEIFQSSIEWFPNGKNSIRVKLKDNAQYAFSFINSTNWKLETLQSFIDSMS